MTGCCIIAKCDVFRQIMLPEDYFMYFEDVDFCLELNEINIKMYYTPDFCIYHKVSSSVGVESPFFVYYWNRNRIILLKKYKHKFGTIFYFIRMFFFLLTRLMKTICYLLHGNYDKNEKMIEGIKAGMRYTIKIGDIK